MTMDEVQDLFKLRFTDDQTIDIFNILNRVNWTPTLGIGNTTLANWQAGLPGTAREMQIGTRIAW